jgi:hypothetical protein
MCFDIKHATLAAHKARHSAALRKNCGREIGRRLGNFCRPPGISAPGAASPCLTK